MKATIHSTDKIVEINGVPARVWEGKTDSGIEVTCFITRIGIKATDDATQFEKELKECQPPMTELGRSIDLRIIL